jgi:dGTPase
MSSLRDFMFEHVYLSPDVTQERAKIKALVKTLFDYYCDHSSEIPTSIPEGELPTRVTDHIAGMTDRFAVTLFEAIAVPTAFTA